MAYPDFSPLSPRKRLYLQQLPDVIAGKITKREAARRAGFSENSQISKIESPQLKAQFARLLRRYVPMHKIAQRISEGMDAKETKFFQKDGIVTDEREVINFAERRQYTQLAAEFAQYADPEEPGFAQGPASAPIVNVNFVIPQPEPNTIEHGSTCESGT
jgi:hypothetical protein